MTKQTFDINKLRVASPCSVGWETMTGDERVRHCQSCRLNVYNISEMTNTEAENLMTKREGRLCLRFYKRADGTVLTKDCPVGLRAYQKRAARFAGATLAAVLGLFSISFGQKDDKKAIDASKLDIVRTISQKNILSGTIVDPNGAVILDAEILLFKDKINVGKITSDEKGDFSFSSVLTGIYSLEVRKSGFKVYKVKNIKINNNEKSEITILLNLNSETEVIGIYAEDPLIDTTSSSITTTITREMIDRVP